MKLTRRLMALLLGITLLIGILPGGVLATESELSQSAEDPGTDSVEILTKETGNSEETALSEETTPSEETEISTVPEETQESTESAEMNLSEKEEDSEVSEGTSVSGTVESSLSKLAAPTDLL